MCINTGYKQEKQEVSLFIPGALGSCWESALGQRNGKGGPSQ